MLDEQYSLLISEIIAGLAVACAVLGYLLHTKSKNWAGARQRYLTKIKSLQCASPDQQKNSAVTPPPESAITSNNIEDNDSDLLDITSRVQTCIDLADHQMSSTISLNSAAAEVRGYLQNIQQSPDNNSEKILELESKITEQRKEIEFYISKVGEVREANLSGTALEKEADDNANIELDDLSDDSSLQDSTDSEIWVDVSDSENSNDEIERLQSIIENKEKIIYDLEKAIYGKNVDEIERKSGTDLWIDNLDDNDIKEIARGSDEKKQVFFDHFTDWREKNRNELKRLNYTITSQKNVIADIRDQLEDVESGNAIKPDVAKQTINSLERMLSEAETCVGMLEQELDELREEINQLEGQLNAKSDLMPDSASRIEGENSPENGESESGNEQMQAQLSSANDMVMMLMSTSGEQGNVINFARDSIGCHDLQSLCKTIIDAVGNYDLKCCLKLVGKKDKIQLSNDGKISSIDRTRLNYQLKTERFQEIGSELLVSFDSISLLIKNLPVEDPDKVGRIKDYLAIILELAESEVANIEAEAAVKQQQKVLKSVIRKTDQTITAVDQQFSDYKYQSRNIIDALTGVATNETFTNSMEPEFRSLFMNILKESKENLRTLNAKPLAVESEFASTVKHLSRK